MAGKSVGSSWRVLLRRARFPSDLASISMAKSFLRPLDSARERGLDTRGLLTNVLPRSRSPCLSTSTTLTGSHSIGDRVDSRSGVESMDLVVIIGNVLVAFVVELGARCVLLESLWLVSSVVLPGFWSSALRRICIFGTSLTSSRVRLLLFGGCNGARYHST